MEIYQISHCFLFFFFYLAATKFKEVGMVLGFTNLQTINSLILTIVQNN